MAGSAPTTRREPRPRGAFRAFEQRGYRCLWLANCLIYTARWMQMTLLAWLVLELTNSPWLVALVGFFSSAPMFLLGLVGGLLADRMPRQRLLTISQGTNTLSSFILTLVLAAGTVEVWHAYLAILTTGACWALDTPSRRAVMYDLLGAEGVTNALALDSVGMNASRMCGPGLAGLLITTTGVTGGYVVITLFCTVAWVLVWSVHMPQARRQERHQQSIIRNLAEGFRYVRSNRTIKATLYITVVMNVLLFPYVQMVPIVARDVLHVDAALMGALQAAEGLGALLGAICIASAVQIKSHGRVFLGGSLVALLALCIFSMSRWYILSLPMLLCLGVGTAGFGAMQSTIIMLAAGEEMRGRALGVLSIAIGTGPFGSLIVGAVASAVHPVFAIRMHALIGIVALAIIMLLFPSFTERTPPVRVTPRPRQARN
ncbi:MAG: MFS transporter [Candidatus Tectimicrobiota bacterium]